MKAVCQPRRWGYSVGIEGPLSRRLGFGVPPSGGAAGGGKEAFVFS